MFLLSLLLQTVISTETAHLQRPQGQSIVACSFFISSQLNQLSASQLSKPADAAAESKAICSIVPVESCLKCCHQFSAKWECDVCVCVREKLTRWRLSQQLNTDEELLLTHTLLSHHGQMSTQASLQLARLNFLLRVLKWFVYLSLLMVTCWFNRFNCFHSGVGLRYMRFSACRWSALLLLFFITSDFARDSEGSPKSEQYVQECSMSKSEIPLYPAHCARSGV